MLVSSAKLTELQAKVTQLEADLGTATTGQAALQTELTQAKADLETAKAKGISLEGALAEEKGKVTKLEADLVLANKKASDAEASVETKVTERLASAGVDPVKRDPSAKVGDDGKPKIDAAAPPRQRAVSAMSGWKIFGKN